MQGHDRVLSVEKTTENMSLKPFTGTEVFLPIMFLPGQKKSGS